MNFLGHLYFSNNDLDLMYANLYGDFVRGTDLSRFSPKIQQGIRLHRTIDTYIDHHPAVLNLLHELYEPLPKIAGIAVDLYFDHLLAKHWEEFHTIPLDEFIANFHKHHVDKTEYDHEFFWFVLAKMEKERWLYQYQFTEGLVKASSGLSKRISFPNALHTAPQVFADHRTAIEAAFRIYMQEAIPHFSDYFYENQL